MKWRQDEQERKMQICRSLVGGKPVAGTAPAIDKIYPATGEVIARVEPADDSVLDLP